MSERKRSERQRRPSARRPSGAPPAGVSTDATTPSQKERAEAESKDPAPKRPRKRVAARRGSAEATSDASGTPGAAKKRPRKKASARASRATTATPPVSDPAPATEPVQASASPERTPAEPRPEVASAPPSSPVSTPEAFGSSHDRSGAPLHATAEPADAAADPAPAVVRSLQDAKAKGPEGVATASERPSIAPPGVLVADDDWETVAEGGPLLEPVRSSSGPPPVQPANNGKRVLRRRSAAVGHLTAHSRVAGRREDDVLGTAHAVLGADFYYQQWGREGLRRIEQDVDDFGLDPHFESRVRPWLEAVCRHYFRVEVLGAENLPRDGRALLVANRSGALPWDGLVLKEALRLNAPQLPALRWLAEDSVFYYPFLGVFMNRVGAVRACPENAERLLKQSSLVAVFPEGARGAGRLFRDRHQLQRFGRGGYVRLALRSQAPVVPVAIVGGEEAYPLLARSKLLGRLIGASYMPVTPTFPWLGPAGLLPAPVKWRIVIGEPLDLGSYGREGADDSLVVHRLNEQIRCNLQSLVDKAARGRGRALL